MIDIPLLGTANDITKRRTEQRTDSAERQLHVQDARKLIYDEGLNVNLKRVDELLKPESLVPTEVRNSLIAMKTSFNATIIEHILEAALRTGIQLLSYACGGPPS